MTARKKIIAAPIEQRVKAALVSKATLLGTLCDLAYELRDERQARQRDVDAMKATETVLAELILTRFKEQKIDRASGARATCSRNPKIVPRVKDWDKFYAHLKKSGEFELLQRRVNETAWQERQDAGVRVPGVEGEPITKLSITKAGGKR